MSLRMFKVVLLSLIISSFVYGQEKEARSPEAGQAYNSGLTFARTKKYDKAIPKFKEAITHDANFPQANYMLAYSYQKTGQQMKAIAAYQEAIRLDSKFEKAYIALAKVQISVDKTNDAINTYKAVLQFNDKSVKANYGLGKIYYAQKKNSEALKYLKASIAVNAKYAPSHNILGLTYFNMKKWADSETEFKLATETASKKQRHLKGTYFMRLGEAQIKGKKYSLAEKSLLQGLKLTKRASIKAACNFHLGEVYKFKGQSQKAISYFKKSARSRNWKQASEYEIDLIKNPDKYSY